MLDNQTVAPITFEVQSIRDRVAWLAPIKAAADLPTLRKTHTRFLQVVKYLLTMIDFEIGYDHVDFGDPAYLFGSPA
jgi:hypothetical protein